MGKKKELLRCARAKECAFRECPHKKPHRRRYGGPDGTCRESRCIEAEGHVGCVPFISKKKKAKKASTATA
jgi:hypothetical protein